MDSSQIKKKLQQIHAFIENKQLKEAFDGIKDFTAIRHNWSISQRLSELETNYRYMIHYLLEGNKDPEQQRIYNQLIHDTYTLADDAAEMLLLENASSFFFDKLRTQNVRTSISVEEYRSVISKQMDTFSFIDLLEEGTEKQTRINQNTLAHEHTLQDLFYEVLTAERCSGEQWEQYNRFMGDNLVPVQDKSMFVTALMFNILQRFDAKKTAFLLDLCNHPESEIAIRAIIGIIPVFQKYTRRWELYPECTNRLALLADDIVFNRRFVAALIQFIQARETEKITKKLTEEIIPEMMKISPMIGKKIRLDEWMGETGMDDKNPEWQKIFDDAGLTDKLQEFSELQLEGADVFHSTFANLKTYPFFNEMSNWFLPFDANHSQVQQLFSDKAEGKILIDSMMRSPLICNSDKYSFCFSIMMMPEEYRKMMISQLGAESDELKKMQEEEFTLRPYQKEEGIGKQYMQDLYRFFKLYPRHRDFTDIFELPFNYLHIPAFRPIVSETANLERVALYFFEKNNFSEALYAYTLLSETVVPKSEIHQKIGYCKQMLGDIGGALDAYRHADLIDDKNTWLLKRIAQCYRLLKQPRQALEQYRRLEQLHPDDLNIQLNIGHCHLELKDYDKALNYYFKVELQNSGNTRAWRSIAWCAFLSRKFDIARNYYAQILEKKPNAHDYLNAAHVELCMENTKQALEFYKLSLRAASDFTVFKSMLEEDIDELQEAGVNTDMLPILLDTIRYDNENPA